MRMVWMVVLVHFCFSTARANDTTAFRGLLERIASVHRDKFRFEYIDSENGKDVFELSSGDSVIILKGNNNNSLAVALNHYLKYYCFTSVSWYANDPVELPAVLPSVTNTVRQRSKVGQRFFLNYCTFGYTFPWWQWRDWERLIDWMALNGVNMPLAITGQEAIWLKVWKEFGLEEEQVRSFFTGPAHLPWHRMANIDSWQGPLPRSYTDHQLNLQKRILERERQFNMKPVLPAFSGHVPLALSKKFPLAKITRLGPWSEFPDKYRSYFLDPFDSLFNKIQASFLREQTAVFGTDHIYGADPFNELTPPSWEPSYLASVASAIYSSIKKSDAEGRWLMMTWIFYFEREHWTNERIQPFVRNLEASIPRELPAHGGPARAVPAGVG